VAEALADVLIEPPLHDRDRGWIASWFGRAFLGARVEWVAGVYPKCDDSGAPNEFGPTAKQRLERVTWEGRLLLVCPLDTQLAVSEARNLDARVEAIRRFQSGLAYATIAESASTTAGSNCVPACLRTSSSAAGAVRAAR